MPEFDSETADQAGRVAEDVAALKRDVAALIAQMKELAMRGAGHFSHEAADSISDHASDLYEAVADTGRRSADKLSAQVEERPVTSLLLAFAAGFIFSKIITR